MSTETTYGYRIKWSRWDGTWNQVETCNHFDPDTAKSCAFEIAKQTGWTPRKWWQLWRWSDEEAPTMTTRYTLTPVTDEH